MKPSVFRRSATKADDRTRSLRSRARGSTRPRGSRPPRSGSVWSGRPQSGSYRHWRSPPSAKRRTRGLRPRPPRGLSAGSGHPKSAPEVKMTATISHARLRVLFAFFAVASLVLSARLAYWQTIGRGELLGQATDQVRSDLVLAAHRGVIRDRGGAILATTVELRSLYAIPGRIVDRGATAAALAPILGERPDVLRAALESGGEWLYLRRRLPEDTANRIAALRIEGLGFEKEPKRLYPSGAIGAQVLGFVNDDGLGQYGVEGRYDDVLRGVPGRLVVERDPASRQLALGLRTGLNAKDGQDLVLTLDLAIQTAVERELAAAVQSERATSGSVVVLDPRDGAVRALASSPSYDPARVARRGGVSGTPRREGAPGGHRPPPRARRPPPPPGRAGGAPPPPPPRGGPGGGGGAPPPRRRPPGGVSPPPGGGPPPPRSPR